MKKISAIISTYNSEQFIAGKLDDLLAQTIVQDLEIIVIDSGSEQNEGAIVKRYMDMYPNIMYMRTELRESIYQAWNRAIEQASGHYITNANCDDRLRPDALEILSQELDKDPEVALVYGDFFITGYPNMTFDDHVRTGYSLKPEFDPAIMLSGCHMGPQPMWRKAVHDEIGLFDEEYRACGDYEFWCRMASYGYKMKHIAHFLGLYLHNADGIINSNVEVCRAEERRVKAQYGHLLPQPTYEVPSGYFYSSPVYENEYANICFVVEHMHDDRRHALESLWKITRFPHCITVVRNGKDNEENDRLEEMRAEGIIKNVIVLDEKVSMGEALNQAFECEPHARYLVNVDDHTCMTEELWLRHMVKRAFEHKETGVITSMTDPGLFLTPREVFDAVGGFAKSNNELMADYCLRVMNNNKTITNTQGTPIEVESLLHNDYTTHA